MTNVGGGPAQLSGGAATLHTAGTALDAMSPSIKQVGGAVAGAAGGGDLAAAAERFFAAWSAMVGATGSQLLAAAQLTSNAGHDLTTAGGH